VLVRFAAALPAAVKLTVVADRGFCDHKLYRVLHDRSASSSACAPTSG
jgi:hypothetical protein